MKLFQTIEELYLHFSNILTVNQEQLILLNRTKFIEEALDSLVYQAVFNPNKKIKGTCRGLIKKAANELKAIPSSIQNLYEAMGQAKEPGYTVPAINVRGLTYDMARATVRAAKHNHSGTFIFEIAKSEIGYTNQSPSEYASVVLAAALRERYEGPVFIQGDHFQANAKKYLEDPEKEMKGLRALIKEAIQAGFYNIDIDTSTLVDLSKPTVQEQQRVNFERAAELSAYIRSLEPPGITISIGGEIGEVGGKNSTIEELETFMDNYLDVLHSRFQVKVGISKISIQTGTSHGGVPLADGTIARVKLDFDTLKNLSEAAREKYHLAGAVQHGASTLPDEAFDRFPETGTAEIHLATGFQNLMYEHPRFPSEFKKEIYDYLRANFNNEKKVGETDEQFIYKTRKKAYGVFKEKMWNLPLQIREEIGNALEEKFDFLFKKLKSVNTDERVKKIIPLVPLSVRLDSEIARS